MAVNKIKISEALESKFAISTEEGDLLFQKINELLSHSEIVLLDFSGVEIIVSTFLNASVGQLYGIYSADFIKDHLKVENMSGDDLNILKKVVDRAKDYFSDQRGFEETLKKYFSDGESNN